MPIQENKYLVQYISAEQTIPLRSKILRSGQPIENSFYKEDNFSTTFHLGIFTERTKKNVNLENDKIICNGTFMKDLCSFFPDETSAYRLRGMATDFDFRGLHLGSLLLKFAENELRSRRCNLLWFNARESAFVFYEKNGFKYLGEMFDIAGIGPHKVMCKFLI